MEDNLRMIHWFIRVGALMLLAAVIASGCSIITDADRGLAERTLHDSTGCVYIQGSGGAAIGAIPIPPAGVPLGGQYGQGSLVVARSNRPDAKVRCDSTGASVE